MALRQTDPDDAEFDRQFNELKEPALEAITAAIDASGLCPSLAAEALCDVLAELYAQCEATPDEIDTEIAMLRSFIDGCREFSAAKVAQGVAEAAD